MSLDSVTKVLSTEEPQNKTIFGLTLKVLGKPEELREQEGVTSSSHFTKDRGSASLFVYNTCFSIPDIPIWGKRPYNPHAADRGIETHCGND